MLRWFEYRQVYRPSREWVATPSAVGRSFEDVYFSALDGMRLNAWFFEADDKSARKNKVILICHGNGGNISYRVELCRVLLRTGTNVMVFDYRGYGRSEGRPNEEGTYCDTQAAYEWLRGRGFKPENIIAFGESLGGAIACELALREGLGGLILLSTFTSIVDVGVEFYPWLPVRWLNTLKYNTLEKLRRIKVPVLIMHSPGDGLIGIGHAQKNFAAANEPKLFWETAGDHNYMLPSDHDLCAAGVEKFLKTLEPQGQIIPAAT